MDSRVNGNLPVSSDIIGIRVSETTWLGDFVMQVLNFHSLLGNFEKMKIYCHGYVAPVQDERRSGRTVGLGGLGLQFCREGITLETVCKLTPLYGKIQQISIPACRAADTGSGTTASGRTMQSNGLELMRRIAITTGAQVRASINTQGYRTDGENRVIRLGEWEGCVLTWSGNGELSSHAECHGLDEADQ